MLSIVYPTSDSYKDEDIGNRGSTLAWVKAFLSNRKQCVRVDGSYSSWSDVTSGIPQESVLGPILSVIFINDMPDVLESMCQLFADDAKIFRNVDIWDDTNTRKLQEDLDKLTKWSKKWQLPFNVRKCSSLHIGRNTPFHKYKMNGRKLDQVYEEKDLGMMMDNEHKFHEQTSALVKKASRIPGIIKKSFTGLDKTMLPYLYKLLARSQLKYRNVVWGPTCKGNIKSTERIQRRATKLVSAIKTLEYEERRRNLGIQSLANRRRRWDIIMTSDRQGRKGSERIFLKSTQITSRS